MDHKISLNKFLITLLSIAAVASTTSFARPNQQQFNDEGENEQKNAIWSQGDNKFKAPFILLMSSHEICVSQLPLIVYGNVSVVYRLADDHDWSESELKSSSKEKKIADVPDFEQMPGASPSMGKSERQQIAANEHHSSHDREEVGKRRNEDVPARGIKETGPKEVEAPTRALPRKERSSRSTNDADAGNSLLATNDGTVNNNDGEASRGAVQESLSVMPATNVTSVRSISSQEEAVRRGRTEEDEPKNGAIQFSDFDVHMKLGFVFVVDSRGRIHRFKLNGYGDSNVQPGDSNTNSIGTGISFDDSRSEPLRVVSSSTSHPNITDPALSDKEPHNSTHDDDGLSQTDSDNANKVGLYDVAGAIFGRHPSTSGTERNLGLVERKNGGSSTSDPSSLGTNYDQRHGPSMINSAKPRIIWSRMKHGILTQRSTSLVASSKQLTSSVENSEKGASPSTNYNLGSGINDQMANDAEQMDGDSESEEPLSDEHRVSGGAEGVDQTSQSVIRQRSNGLYESRTEVAVDWLNDLLFVLDKQRLLAIDYDGGNELILIDDFGNQPVNLKADPINGFLFWLQEGKFYNTIYKLDLNVLDRFQNSSRHDTSLISHHYAHPIVTNLPTYAKLFIIDHKHSRIYVPLSSRRNDRHDANKTQRTEDAEVFSNPSDEVGSITHMNSTSASFNELPLESSYEKTFNITSASNMVDGQILAYNLDGTDVGPLRSAKKSSSTYNFEDILDITLDTNKGLLYWLTNDGKDLFEEYQAGKDTSYHQAQHNLEGERYIKLLHFDRIDNQPARKARFNLRKLFLNLASSTETNRLARSDRLNSMDDPSLAYSLNGNNSNLSLTGASKFIVFTLGCVVLASLFGIFVYFVARPSLDGQDNQHNGGSSSTGSFMGESHVDSVAHTSAFIGASTISRWIPRPSTGSADTSTFQRSIAKNEPLDSCDFESSINYGQSNAIDEHYRDSIYDQTVIQFEQNCLTNLSKWPSKMHEVSNRLYVPIELQEDETLSSIHRVSIEQLNIEKRSPLGEGHFGTVLQGTITCTLREKDIMLNKSTNRNSHSFIQDHETRDVAHVQGSVAPSSTSSGHGSSSVSSEFITANSVAETINGDYLLPKSNTNSATSDYSFEDTKPTMVKGFLSTSNHYDKDPTRETRFKVAIKKLKENASPKERSDFLQEAKHLAKFDHPNIVSLIGICLDRGSTLIVMELMLGGDLIRYMQENKPTLENQDKLTYNDLLSICLDIVNACCYLEEREHIHRDLAARNCLVSSRKKEDRVVKLADFGLARDIYKDSYYKKLNDSAMPLKWMAPECFMEQKFTIKSDVWSFGVVMWEVMSYCQDKPYNNVEHFMMKDHLVEGLRLGKPEHCCEDVYRLMNECWQLDPNRRPTFEECRATLIEIKSSSS